MVIVGDSVYKDLVLPLQKDCLPSSSQLKAKGELSFEHHTRLEGCRREGLHPCTRYRETRPIRACHSLVLFYFLARLLAVCGGHPGANAVGRASPGRAGPQLLPLRPLSGWPGLPEELPGRPAEPGRAPGPGAAQGLPPGVEHCCAGS